MYYVIWNLPPWLAIILSTDQVRGFEEHQIAQGEREVAQLDKEDEGVRGRQQRNVQEEEDARTTRRAANEGAEIQLSRILAENYSF